MIKIEQGNCLNLMQEIENKSIDLILCDLPYGCGKTVNKWDNCLDLSVLWENYNRIIKDNGIIALFSQEPFTSELIMSNVSEYRYKWLWEKDSPTGFLNCNYKPLSLFEEIVIFSKATVGSLSKNSIKYNPQGVISVDKEKRNNPNSTWRVNKGYGGNNKLNSDSGYIQHYTNYPVDIIKFNRDNNAVHPTQKPVALLEYLIKTYTNKGETVLDNCMGSGSTMVACIHTNRNGIGMELDENYFEIAKKRIDEELEKHKYSKVSLI